MTSRTPPARTPGRKSDARSTHTRPTPPANGESSPTRARVIVAALDAIHAYGYRNASSNKIAEHAGVTWGVIQYHFGTRERLLLAVLQASIDDVEGRIDAINEQLPGNTFDERFDAWETLVLESFGYTLFPGILQIVFDLGRDPSVADETLAELDRYNFTIKRLRDLAAQLGGDAPLSAGLAEYIYWSSWSTAVARSMNLYLRNHDDPRPVRLQHLRAATAALVASATETR